MNSQEGLAKLNMTCRPTVYVLVPFYGRLHLVEQCVRSLKSQSIDFRAVLVDDGSPGRITEQTLRLADDERFVIINRSKNEGPAAARHTGLEHIISRASDSDVVVLVDGDDFLARDRALEIIADTYAKRSSTKMTFGGMVTTCGAAVMERRYRNWQIQLGLTRHVPTWRATHPRTFRAGHYRRNRDEVRARLPNGTWLPAATDMALVFPLLDQCSADEVAQIELPLYVYRCCLDAPEDPGYRQRQRFGEFYARHSVPFLLMKLFRRPYRVWSAFKGGLEILGHRRPPETR